MNSQHTPTPWQLQDGLSNRNITTSEGDCIARVDMAIEQDEQGKWHPNHEVTEANAAFIVRACNSHEALVEALGYYVAQHRKWRFDLPERNENDGKEWNRTLAIAEAALGKAQGNGGGQ